MGRRGHQMGGSDPAGGRRRFPLRQREHWSTAFATSAEDTCSSRHLRNLPSTLSCRAVRCLLNDRSSRRTRERGDAESDFALTVSAMISTVGRNRRPFRDGQAPDPWLQFPWTTAMMTDPATAIKREVFQLIDQQIEILRQEGRLTDSDLDQLRLRSGRISELYQELDRVVRSRISAVPRFAKAS